MNISIPHLRVLIPVGVPPPIPGPGSESHPWGGGGGDRDGGLCERDMEEAEHQPEAGGEQRLAEGRHPRLEAGGRLILQ